MNFYFQKLKLKRREKQCILALECQSAGEETPKI